MKEKINIAELLKDCPKGMKLYSPIFGEVYLDKIRPHLAIVVTTDKDQGNFKEEFFYDGRYGMNGECILFPSKDQRDWSKFHRPFKDGDILTYMFWNKPTIYIYRENGGYTTSYYAAYSTENKKFYNIPTGALAGNRDDLRFATEEEKQTLFKAIKENGYKWNAETKTLEKLIVPKFKKGDKVRIKNGVSESRIIEDVCDTFYSLVPIGKISFTDQDNWELAPNKFNIATLKPYDKVLYRMHNKDTWCNSFYCFYKNNHHFITSLTAIRQCIPYEGNEHLLGTTNDCADYYKTWK